MKKIQLRKIVILLALSATPSVYASELSMTPFGVDNPVKLTISFTSSTVVEDIGFSSSSDPEAPCGNRISASYVGGTFLLGAGPSREVYFNGYLPAIANDLELCTDIISSGTISLDGVVTDRGLCPAHAGCYSYTCNAEHEVDSITLTDPLQPLIQPFTATCA